MSIISRSLACILCMVTVISHMGCDVKKSDKVDQQQLNTENKKISALLHDTAFAASMAAGQEAAYYTSQNQPVEAFFEGSDSLVKKSLKEEKIAINLAGFYAVECGVAALASQKGQTPVEWLNKIVDNSVDSSDMLLLNRFANATWKAGQPFRSLERISRENFIAASMLSNEELKKDADQVRAAAKKFLDSLEGVQNRPLVVQLKKISFLLRNKVFAEEMARHMDAAYYVGQGKPAPPFLSPGEDTATVAKSARSEKIAINIAGFYALECGLNYLSEVQQKLPSVLLKEIISDSLPAKDKELLERFANATWKAGQPFRSLDRINRPVFMPYDLLSKEEQEKDWKQIKSAALKLQEAMK
jgi:hypothetical protein